MKELYLIPSVEIVEFDVKDVIRTSGEEESGNNNDISSFNTSGNEDTGWSGLY